ncbi:MAG: VCBS repeat-containing protein [Polyangiaceae bacterium]|nr:VCBS repeat-containing protein [Polyangiaceae bacterium]
MRYLAGAALLALSGFAACGGDDGAAAPHGTVDAGTEGGVDAAADADAAPGCGTAGPTLSAGTELAFDDGTPHADIRHQTAAITIDGTEYKLAEAPLWEAVRFELAHPAKVLGFRVQWANVDAAAAPDMKLEAGLYGDFGYNGFDFWAPDPLWTGTRCVSDMTDGQWLDYALPEPVVIDEPGLVYVAHHAASPTDPVFYYDDSAADNCDAFDSCRSAFNLPEVPGYYNGTSFPFQRDFLVRLVVEYTDDVKPADKLFQEVPTESGDHVSWADYDGDGFDDALVSGKLLKNDGGTFSDVTQSAGLAGVSATGGVFGDYDNDGCLDLFLFSESPANGDTLMRSKCDGTFEDVTAAAKITDLQSYEDCGDPANVHAPSAAAAWVDLDADGFLDLYVANFICWSKETYYIDTVFHNEKDGTFSDWTGTHGFSSNKAPSRGAAPADADGDGDIDLFVNAYRLRPNYFFVNDGSGTVSESGQTTGLAGVATQAGVVVYFGHTIGAAWGSRQRRRLRSYRREPGAPPLLQFLRQDTGADQRRQRALHGQGRHLGKAGERRWAALPGDALGAGAGGLRPGRRPRHGDHGHLRRTAH